MDSTILRSYLDDNPFAKLGDVVTQMLYDAIVTLELPPASKINVNQLAADLGISRTPVSEAVAKLQTVGYVEQHKGANGYYVVDMNLADMMSLYSTREAIECEAVYLCAENVGADTLAKLEGLAAEFGRIFSKQDGQLLKETDMPFHRLIVDSCGNKYLQRCYKELLPNITMYQSSWIKFIDPDMINPWTSKVVHQHSAIVSAIKLHLPGLAREAMSQHIRSSQNFVAFSDNTSDPFSIVKHPNGK